MSSSPSFKKRKLIANEEEIVGKSIDYDLGKIISCDRVLNDISGILGNYDQNDIEIELRLGIILQNNSFHSGIDFKDFLMLRECMFLNNKKTDFEIIEETDFVKIYDLPIDQSNDYGNNLRVSFEEVEVAAAEGSDKNAKKRKRIVEKPVKAGVKELIGKINFPLIGFDYDFRISVARENEHQTPETMGDNWRIKRKKNRKSYVVPAKGIRYDFTETTQEYFSGEISNTFEIEIELLPESTNQFMSNTLSRKEIISNLIISLRNLLLELKYDDPYYLNDLDLKEKDILEKEMIFLSQDFFYQFSEFSLSSSNVFPGSMPVALNRGRLNMIQSLGPEDYFVSEKTDGVRYMLILPKDKDIFFVGRDMKFKHLIGSGKLFHLIWGNGGTTLLDGEIVRNRITKKLVFMIFDVISINGDKSIGLKPLKERLHRIQEKLLVPFRNMKAKINQNQKERGGEEFLIDINTKMFFPRKDCHLLSNLIKDKPFGCIFNDNRSRNHKSDGLIFTPNEPYNLFSTNRVFKWKSSSEMSIDFRIVGKVNQDGTQCPVFFGLSRRNMEIDIFEPKFSFMDIIRLNRDKMNRSELAKAVAPIAECSFDNKSGLWKYHSLREDKLYPNHISVIFDTIQAMAENISFNEVLWRCKHSDLKDREWFKIVDQSLGRYLKDIFANPK